MTDPYVKMQKNYIDGRHIKGGIYVMPKRRQKCYVVFSIIIAAVFLVSTISIAMIRQEKSELQVKQGVLEKRLSDMEEDLLSGYSADEFEITAYDPSPASCGKWAKFGKTKTGTNPHKLRTVAVDPNIIPLGSLVYIDSIGWRIAEDTGRLIKGKTIDLFFDTYIEARDFGRQKVKVYYYKNA
jgi:3D (Asp-Asp-Asp) domain-containing protein